MLRMFALGYSHIAALLMAWQAQGGGAECDFLLLNNPEFQPALQDEHLSPAIAQRIGPAALYVSLVGGNDHSVMVMLNHPRRFDFILPEAQGLGVDESAEVLPAGLLRDELQRRIAPHLQLLARYRDAVSGRMVHVESPPPVPSAAHIETYPGFFKDLIAERGVAPALLRYKMWRLHSALYRDACARLGVEFLPAPAQMQDDLGMMTREAWNQDPTHGNVLYGRHVLGQLQVLP